MNQAKNRSNINIRIMTKEEVKEVLSDVIELIKAIIELLITIIIFSPILCAIALEMIIKDIKK